MKRLTLSVAVVIIAVIGWHLFLSFGLNKEFCPDQTSDNAKECDFMVTVEVNPMNDLVTVKTPGPNELGVSGTTATMIFNMGRDLLGVPEAEHRMNIYARQYFDFYAILIPYKVSITDREQASGPPSGKTNQEAGRPRTLPTVTVLGFAAEESPTAAAEHAVALGMDKVNNCAYRKDGNATLSAYVDCGFSGNKNDSLIASFYLGKLQRVEYRFPTSEYDAVLIDIERSLGNPRTLTDPYDPSVVVSLDWGSVESGFDVGLGKTADQAEGWVSVVFQVPNQSNANVPP